MTVTVNQYSRNQVTPFMQTDQFVPDQLIAGLMQIVTRQVTLASGKSYARGTVMGRISSRTLTSASSLTTGNGTIGTISSGDLVLTGAYTITATAATSFTVKDPQGNSVGTATVGTAFESDQISFTLTAGTTAFAAGDKFTVTVGAETNQWCECVKNASDGSQVPRGIMVNTVDATSAAVETAMYVSGEFNENAIAYDDSWTLSELENALPVQTIYLKTAASNAI